jgi:hypothetical protein
MSSVTDAFQHLFEKFLHQIERPDLLSLGYGIRLDDGEEIKINAAAYADDLIIYAESYEDMEILLRHLRR